MVVVVLVEVVVVVVVTQMKQGNERMLSVPLAAWEVHPRFRQTLQHTIPIIRVCYDITVRVAITKTDKPVTVVNHRREGGRGGEGRGGRAGGGGIIIAVLPMNSSLWTEPLAVHRSMLTCTTRVRADARCFARERTMPRFVASYISTIAFSTCTKRGGGVRGGGEYKKMQRKNTPRRRVAWYFRVESIMGYGDRLLSRGTIATRNLCFPSPCPSTSQP